MDKLMQFEQEKVYDVDNYIYFTSDLVDEKLSEKETQFFIRSMNLGPTSNVLDMPCGYGRHANILAKYVGSVTGVDISPAYINIARRDAENLAVRAQYVLGDMRDLKLNKHFDAVIMVFTSFSIFDHDENVGVLKTIAESLTVGGQFCLEIMNPSHVLRHFKKDYVFEKEGNLMIDRLSYDEVSNRFMSRRIYIKNGVRVDALLSHELFSKEQLDVIMKPLGLEINDVYGSCTGELYTDNSHKMILLGRKRSLV